MCCYLFIYLFFNVCTYLLSSSWTSPSPPRFLPSIFIEHRVQQSHCSSIFHRVLLTHALALSQVNLCTIKSPHEFIRVCTREGLYVALARFEWTSERSVVELVRPAIVCRNSKKKQARKCDCSSFRTYVRFTRNRFYCIAPGTIGPGTYFVYGVSCVSICG